MKKEHCRLCWCQARLDRSAALDGAIGTYTLLLPHVRRVRHQQLFLADLPAPRDLVGKPHQRRHGVGPGAPGIARKSPPPIAGRPQVDWIQPPLFLPGPRDYRRRIDLRAGPALNNPWLAWALHLAHTFAEARGFDTVVREALNRALVMLLADHCAGEMIRFSDIRRVLRKRGNSAHHAAHVLELMGVLDDDQPRAIDGWLDRKLHGIAPGIARHVRAWAQALIDGGPRTKPRHYQTARNYVAALRPVLLDWSTRHEHLREITRDDVLAQVTALRGHQRQTAAVALRSLFRWASKAGVIFGNPTSRLRVGRVEYAIALPLSADEISPTIQAARSPHARVAIVLAAVHAARHGDIINMQMSDVDLANRRMVIADHARPMDDLTHRVLADWLAYRMRRWPNTANGHLLLSRETALRLGPVTHPWINRILRGLPATLERLRIDRQLDEALTSGGDPLQVAEVFGVCEQTAVRYAAAARQLLDSGAERQTGVHDEPPGRLPLEPPDRPLGSS
ncbi:integrase [Planosporangium sp. 12N6]|uniref:integrase n=1 Tax=Planosporangium spinosum TaxID=3402278 RepID=UPI003CEEDC43